MKATTPKQLAELDQGFLSFSVQCPFKQLLNPREAAAALGLVWKDKTGAERRFDTRFIQALFDRGEIEGIRDEEANEPTKALAQIGRKPKTFSRVSRASLMAYCARHWTMPSEEQARIMLDYARDLPVEAMHQLALQLTTMANNKADRQREGMERASRMARGRAA